jgi:hypothetical protein
VYIFKCYALCEKYTSLFIYMNIDFSHEPLELIHAYLFFKYDIRVQNYLKNASS